MDRGAPRTRLRSQLRCVVFSSREQQVEADTSSCCSDFPQVFYTKAEVSKFVTMIIYSCSALHAAVNFSQVSHTRTAASTQTRLTFHLWTCLPQLDFALWLPNCPPSMLRPPPRVKGAVTEDDVASFLPDVNVSCRVLASLSLLSQPAVDFVRLYRLKCRLRQMASQ